MTLDTLHATLLHTIWQTRCATWSISAAGVKQYEAPWLKNGGKVGRDPGGRFASTGSSGGVANNLQNGISSQLLKASGAMLDRMIAANPDAADKLTDAMFGETAQEVREKTAATYGKINPDLANAIKKDPFADMRGDIERMIGGKNLKADAKLLATDIGRAFQWVGRKYNEALDDLRNLDGPPLIQAMGKAAAMGISAGVYLATTLTPEIAIGLLMAESLPVILTGAAIGAAASFAANKAMDAAHIENPWVRMGIDLVAGVAAAGTVGKIARDMRQVKEAEAIAREISKRNAARSPVDRIDDAINKAKAAAQKGQADWDANGAEFTRRNRPAVQEKLDQAKEAKRAERLARREENFAKRAEKERAEELRTQIENGEIGTAKARQEISQLTRIEDENQKILQDLVKTVEDLKLKARKAEHIKRASAGREHLPITQKLSENLEAVTNGLHTSSILEYAINQPAAKKEWLDRLMKLTPQQRKELIGPGKRFTHMDTAIKRLAERDAVVARMERAYDLIGHEPSDKVKAIFQEVKSGSLKQLGEMDGFSELTDDLGAIASFTSNQIHDVGTRLRSIDLAIESRTKFAADIEKAFSAMGHEMSPQQRSILRNFVQDGDDVTELNVTLDIVYPFENLVRHLTAPPLEALLS